MEVSQEQIEQLKAQVLEQINSTFPEDKKQQAISQIELMNQEQFIEFLKQNKLIPDSQDPGSSPTPESAQELQDPNSPQDSPFRQIVRGDLPSYKIDENADCIVVLEINPVSIGHAIIIPKKPVYEVAGIPQTCFSLAKKISKKIKTKFKPKEVTIVSSSVLGEIILNILPQYGDENLGSQRTQAKEEELESIKKALEKKPKTKIPRVKKEKISASSSKSKKIILPKRIP